jgi:4-amino-4-deoxy-L-arabinose transferase-like glycosyltransferase
MFDTMVLIHKLGLPSLMVSHALILLFAAVAVFSADRMASVLAGSEAGLVAGLLVLLSPLFVAQAGLVRLAMPLTAFMLLTLWGAASGRWVLAAVFGSLAVLTKEPGVWLVPPLFAFALLHGPRQKTLRRLVCASIPGVVFVAWMIGGKIAVGHWISRPSIRWGHVGPMIRCTELFFRDGRFCLALLMFAVVLWMAWKARSIWRLVFAAPAFALFWIAMPLLQGEIPYPGLALPVVSAALSAIVLGMGLVWRAKEAMLWGVVLVHLVIFALLRETMPRYLLPALVLFIVLSVRAIWFLPLRWSRYVLVILVAPLFVFSWYRGEEPFGNLNYKQQVQGMKEFALHLQRHHASDRILYDGTGQIFEDPNYGYVEVPLQMYGGKLGSPLPQGTLPDVVITTIWAPNMKRRKIVEKQDVRRVQERWGCGLTLIHETGNQRFRGRVYRVVTRPKRS